MGITPKPRTPSVHRAVTVLDAVAHNVATTPAALAITLSMAKSSIGDLVEALEIENLLRRDSNGKLRLGMRLTTMTGGTPEDPMHTERSLRILGQIADLDEHTVSFVRVVGTQALCVDVRMGQHPLPLTPRPGQTRPIAHSAGALAVLRAASVEAARELIELHASHQGATHENVTEALATVFATEPDRAGIVQLTDAHGILQLGTPMGPERNLAAVVHLPDRLADSAMPRRAAVALTDLTERLRQPRA
jgi:IclR family transcriptional regulator, blcABC operon repressor